MADVITCWNCDKKIEISKKYWPAVTQLEKEIQIHFNPLTYLDLMSKCCDNPDHHWITRS